MKFKKINDNQMIIEIPFEDLKKKEITFEDIQSHNTKGNSFMEEIMLEAADVLDFDLNMKAVIIEALPLLTSTLKIKVTTTDSNISFEEQVEFLIKNKLIPNGLTSEELKTKMLQAQKKALDNMPLPKPTSDKKTNTMYKFDNLDDVVDTCYKLNSFSKFKSALYKHEESYYLFIDLSKKSLDTTKISYILKDFGEEISSSKVSQAFLTEHGKTILKTKAVEKLSQVVDA